MPFSSMDREVWFERRRNHFHCCRMTTLCQTSASSVLLLRPHGPLSFRLGLHCPLSSHSTAQLRQLPPLATVWKSFTFMNIVDCSSTQYPVLDVIELMNLVSLLCIITLLSYVYHYHHTLSRSRARHAPCCLFHLFSLEPRSNARYRSSDVLLRLVPE